MGVLRDLGIVRLQLEPSYLTLKLLDIDRWFAFWGSRPGRIRLVVLHVLPLQPDAIHARTAADAQQALLSDHGYHWMEAFGGVLRTGERDASDRTEK